MENTVENKAVFFAQYWDIPVYVCAQTSGRQTMRINEFCLRQIGKNHCYLYLKPLSDITDEDAIEIYNAVYPNHLPTDNWDKVEQIHEILGEEGYSHKFLDLMESSAFIDNCRSKGYAISYKGLSVEKQIEYGWVELKNRA